MMQIAIAHGGPSAKNVTRHSWRFQKIGVFGENEAAAAGHLDAEVLWYFREYEQIWIALADLLNGCIDGVMVEAGSVEHQIIVSDPDFALLDVPLGTTAGCA